MPTPREDIRTISLIRASPYTNEYVAARNKAVIMTWSSTETHASPCGWLVQPLRAVLSWHASKQIGVPYIGGFSISENRFSFFAFFHNVVIVASRPHVYAKRTVPWKNDFHVFPVLERRMGIDEPFSLG